VVAPASGSPATPPADRPRVGRWSAFVLNRALHRDVGYFVSALAIVYAVSGLAVNHTADWNPSLDKTTTQLELGPLPTDLDAAEKAVVQRAGIDPSRVRGRHRPGPDVFRVFLDEGSEAKVTLSTGKGTLVDVQRRNGLFEANALHLNHLKGVWTWVADVFAVALLFLAIGGLFMLKGRKGLMGRGKWFFSAGLLVPVAATVWYHLTR
jgi:hypothetical protein